MTKEKMSIDKVWMYHHLDANPFMLAYIQRGHTRAPRESVPRGWCQCGVKGIQRDGASKPVENWPSRAGASKVGCTQRLVHPGL